MNSMRSLTELGLTFSTDPVDPGLFWLVIGTAIAFVLAVSATVIGWIVLLFLNPQRAAGRRGGDVDG